VRRASSGCSPRCRAAEGKFAEDVIAATAPVLTAKNDTAKNATAAKKPGPQGK
jgi:hypothetical protein